MSASNAEPIAIIGVGCRFPGGVESAAGLWDLLVDGRDTVGPVPPDRWDAASLTALHDPDEAMRAARGCFLDGDVWAWDPQAFSVAPVEAPSVDPQFRVLLEVAWEAVEHAGIPIDRLRGTRSGVYVGTYAPDNLFREARPVQDAPDSPYLFGNFTAGAAGRIAFAMDLRGPVMVISTHCSSGLVAVDSACAALSLGDCEVALAGAVLLMLSPVTQLLEAPLLLSRRGGCFAFDGRADGYVRGEGAGVLVLKRLSDARRDGDRVLAVIRGSAVNNDGQASRLTAPSTQMQQQLFRRAVDNAAIDPGDVGLVEAHGPGTAVGDPIEFTSIDAVYGRGRGRCALGSVKTNIGHSEPVSGIAGVIKTVQSLRHGEIAPNRNFRAWNPAVPHDGGSRLFVPTELTGWPVPGTAKLAAVCSYGVTGTNAHVVLEAAPAGTHPRTPRAARVFCLSGGTAESLTAASARLSRWVSRSDTDLLDVAHTLDVRRWHAEHRLCIVARDHRELAERAAAYAAGDESDGVAAGTPTLPAEHAGPVFVFTGQGSQRPGMCQDLLATEPVFATTIDELDPLIRAEAGFSLREMITEPRRLGGLDRIQPTLFGVQVALAALWRSWGVEPAAVIGQSLGEVAAAVVAGALRPADGVAVICRRSALLATISGGAMASVLLGADEVSAEITDGVALAVLTSPGTTVVSGDLTQVSALVEQWTARGVVARMIDVDVASHSPQVDPILDPLRAAISDLRPTRPRHRFYSTVSADPRAPEPLDSAYWVRNQRDTVRFQTAVAAALADGHRLFVECTPHPLATRPIIDIAAHEGARDVVAVGSLRDGTHDQNAFLGHLGAVHCAGYDDIDWHGHYRDGTLTDVPGTAWQRTRHGGNTQPYQLIAPNLVGAEQHPLLGGHVHDPDHPEQHLWQTPISPPRLPWLADHQVAGVPVLPGTGLVEMMLAAATRAFDTNRVAVSDVTISSPLVLEPEPTVTTRLTHTGTAAHVEVVSHTADGVIVHAHGSTHPLPEEPREPVVEVVGPEWTDSNPTDLYRHFRERHDIYHGPAFTAVERIQVHPHEDRALATLRIADPARVSSWPMTLHPALLDQLVQTVVAVWLAHHVTSPGPVVVAGFDEVRVHGTPATHARLASVRLQYADDATSVASGVLATADGTIVAEVRGLRLTNITPPAERFAQRLSHLAWEPEDPKPARQTPPAGSWLVLSENAGWPAELMLAIKQRGVDCRVSTNGAALSTVTDRDAGVVLAIGEHATALENVSKAVAVITRLATLPQPPRLWVVTGAGSPPSGLAGLLRTAAYEHPELRPSRIDLAPGTSLDQVAADLTDLDLPTTEIRWRDGQRAIARVRQGASVDTPVPATPAPVVRPGAAYLVTGGLGGLGLRTVEWLAGQGASRVVLNGRSKPAPVAAATLNRLRDTDIVVVPGDIADPAIAEEAVAAATAGGLTLRGVVHAAGVVEDATIGNLDDQLLARVWRGKADGAWTLHQATQAHDLDFFVLYSSVAALIGSPGQAAYAAANTFLDELVEYRAATGLPATSVQWGPWSRVGRGQHLAAQGFLTIDPKDGLDALHRILDVGYREIAYSPLDVERWIAPYPALRDTALLHHLVGEPAEQDEHPLRDQLLAATRDTDRHRLLEEFIAGEIRELLGGTTRHIGPNTSMVALGLDSLGGVQLQQRLQHALDVEIKPGVIWVKPTAADLADWILRQLGTR